MREKIETMQFRALVFFGSENIEKSIDFANLYILCQVNSIGVYFEQNFLAWILSIKSQIEVELVGNYLQNTKMPILIRSGKPFELHFFKLSKKQ